MRSAWRWALAVFVLVALGHSSGGVVFDRGPPSLSGCAPSDFDEPLPPVPGPIQAAGMLAFDVPTIVTDIHWWGVYLLDDVPPERDNFTLRFFHLPPDEYPDTVPWWEASAGHVSRTDTGLRLETWMAPQGESFALYHYAWYDPVGVVVPAGEHILSIVNDTESVPGNWCWAEADSHPYFHLWQRWEDGLEWFPWFYGTLAFQLTDDLIPEPATLVLLGLGLAGLARRARRR